MVEQASEKVFGKGGKDLRAIYAASAVPLELVAVTPRFAGVLLAMAGHDRFVARPDLLVKPVLRFVEEPAVNLSARHLTGFQMKARSRGVGFLLRIARRALKRAFGRRVPLEVRGEAQVSLGDLSLVFGIDGFCEGCFALLRLVAHKAAS